MIGVPAGKGRLLKVGTVQLSYVTYAECCYMHGV